MVSVVVEGRRRVHSTWEQTGAEMIEEFDAKTHELLLRKRRQRTVLGAEGEWVVEVGAVSAIPDRNSEIAPSANNPVFSRLDTADNFQWRIRNLPYDPSVYSVTVENEAEIVVRTSNKKYYKRIDIPDMKRLNLPLTTTGLVWKHQHNTLIITYAKPPQVLEADKKHLAQALKASITV